MRTLLTLILTCLLAIPAAAAELAAEGRIVYLGLFKNGLAVVRREVPVPGPGSYLLDLRPEPVHGTFWIEGAPGAEARMVEREVDGPVTVGRGDPQEELAGQTVTMQLRDVTTPVTGKVAAFPAGDSPAWNRSYESYATHPYSFGYPYGTLPQTQPAPGRFLVLENETGRTWVDTAAVVSIKTEGQPTQKSRRSMLLLTVEKPPVANAPISLVYLTKGLSWAPSYRVDIADPAQLTITQEAVIRNELETFRDARVDLITGFPGLDFGHVVSPFSASTNWSNFFTQLSQRPARGPVSTLNVAMQQAAPPPDRGGGPDLSATPAGQGVDLFFQSVGKRSLQAGESMVLVTASGQAPYERTVEWIIPDTRKADGRFIEEYERQNDAEKYDDSAWDAIRFRNPLPFPMTTAPALITSGEKFCGQHLSWFTNPGESTLLRVTKSLSVRTVHVEHEEQTKREIVSLAGNTYHRSYVEGGFTISNHRAEKLTMLVRRRFSGELLSTAGEPEKSLLEEGAYAVNQRRQLTWNLDLAPGEERTVNYRYSVLVRE